MLIIFSLIVGSLFDKEIKIISLYLFNSSKLLELAGPIITFTPASIISLVAVINFSLFSVPESLGIIFIFLSSISSSAS